MKDISGMNILVSIQMDMYDRNVDTDEIVANSAKALTTSGPPRCFS